MKKEHMTIAEVQYLMAVSAELKPIYDGLTYREAKAVGIGAKQVWQIKNGHPADMHIINMRRACICLGVSVSEILARAEKNAPLYREKAEKIIKNKQAK